jgi:phosphoglycerol transferase MdoB-like AlkP superfamily enzyme
MYPLITVASIINIIKIDLRSEPLVFSDLFMLKEAADFAGKSQFDFTKYLSFLIPVFILLLILPLFIRRVKLNLKKRAVFWLAAICVAFFFFYATIIPERTFIERKMNLTVWDPVLEYKTNGFILSFFKSSKRNIFFTPLNYNPSKVQEYALELGYIDKSVSLDDITLSPDEMPNVIVIMNEAYWDPSNMNNISLNKDPMESVRELMAKNGNLFLLSSQLGGGTANIEYEFLTGKSLLYYPPNAMIYQQFITKKQWSLAWYFRNIGYSTTAIHPYQDWFWKRNIVYPLLGFENMYFNTPGTLNYIDRRGQYIGDGAVSREIISRYLEFSENGEKPVFTFAITMQNHYPYPAGRYKGEEKQIELVKSTENPDLNVSAETYSEGVRYGSNAFIYLTEYFKNVERPTYIILFGDHAPTFAGDPLLYILDENDMLILDDVYNMYKTPLIIWTNLDDLDIYDKIRSINTISPFMLTEEIFNLTQLPKPGYIEMLSKIKEHTNGFNEKYTLDNDGNLVGENPAFVEINNIKNIFNKLRVVQYDATVGKNYFIYEFK